MDAVRSAFQAATGYRYDPATLRSRGATIPVSRALVPMRGRVATAADELEAAAELKEFLEAQRRADVADAARRAR